MIKNIIKKIIAFIQLRFDKGLNNYHKNGGDKVLRYKFDLDNDSVVFDLGGYEGQWSSDIYSRYKCKIFIFEPVKKYFQNIKERFVKNGDIKVFDFGLSKENKDVPIFLNNDGSSVYLKGGKQETVKLKKASDFLKENNFKKIDLIKINIEGGEYDFLEELIESGFINKINELQIQFHKMVYGATGKRERIQKNLQTTHDLIWNYDFVWEYWKIKK